jgi:DNA-binding SARP family transcriptional activator
MSQLRVSVLGPPEVFHDDSRLTFALRKAQALLLYLAVEGGMQSRSKLAALLWPDSEPADARRALRNSLSLLRDLIDDDAAPGEPSHLRSEGDLLGLDPHTPLQLDLAVVQQAYKQAQPISTVPPEPLRAGLVSTLQHALSLVRGPFLDGFWLREETPFDAWVLQLQQQWQVRLQVLCDRLSSWQEASGELEAATATLTHWLRLDPLSEEASRRLMRLHMARGDAAAALQVFATCRARLAEELQVEPSPDTVALAERIRSRAARRSASPQVRPALVPTAPSELPAPFIGRKAAFSQLVGSFQQVLQGHPQAVFVTGEEGIGKTRLANEFIVWARAQGADVLSGHAFELAGRLPYQPLVEVLRPRLEEENAPEDLLDDLWLAELARLLPELRVRYPDLPAPSQDELTGRLLLFEAVARFLDALAKRAPLVLFMDDLHWVDEASLDLLRYLGRYWIRHGTRVLWLYTARSEELEPRPQLSAQLDDLGRDLPITQVCLQSLSQAETRQLVEAIVGEAHERSTASSAAPAGARPAPGRERNQWALGDLLFARTGGQPLALLETLKLLRERGWLVPRVGADGVFRLELAVEMATVAPRPVRCELVPPRVRATILKRLSKLTEPARQLLMASAVLGSQVSAQLLWQMAELGVQTGLEALEEAVRSGMLREEGAGGSGLGYPDNYDFTNDLIHEVIYSELSQARLQILHQRAWALLSRERVVAGELALEAIRAGELALEAVPA